MDMGEISNEKLAKRIFPKSNLRNTYLDIVHEDFEKKHQGELLQNLEEAVFFKSMK